MKEIIAVYPHIPVIILSGSMDVEMIVTCMKVGAKDYQVKPLNTAGLSQVILKQLENRELHEERARLKSSLLSEDLEQPDVFSNIYTKSPKMLRIFSYAEAISRTGMPVLITGETGTGKELMAKALHNLRHASSPFIAINVAGFDDTMFSDALFGHQKGAYTGAFSERKGLVESANEGTLFLDEIGDLSAESQVKLLRLIQEGEYYPLGSERPKKVRLWILAATHRPISTMDTFRRDLFYRLQSHWIDLPPLRERRQDLPVLVHFFLESISQSMNIPLSNSFSEKLLEKINHYSFPGNIRELQGLIADVFGSSGENSEIDEEVLFRWIGANPNEKSRELQQESNQEPVKTIQFGYTLPTLKEMENLLIDEALSRANGNRTLAASILGVSRQTLLNHAKKNV